MGVEVRIVAPNFKNNLRPQLSKIQADLEEHFVKVADDQFGFIDWKPIGKGSPGLSAILILLVTADDAMGNSVSLEFNARRGADAERLPFDCLTNRPYSEPFVGFQSLKRRLFTSKDPQHPALLVPRVEEVVEEALSNADFQRALARSFLRKIPICNEANLVQGKLFALGVKRDELRADEGSLMQLGLCVAPPGKAEPAGGQFCLVAAPKTLPGKQLMTRFARCEEPPWRCRFDDLDDESCEQRVPFMFDHRVKDSVNVFMLDYHPGYVDTEGGLTTSSGKGAP